AHRLDVVQGLGAGALLGQQGLGGVEVRVGEGDVLLALLRDGHARGGQVALVGGHGGAALDHGEVDVDDLLLDTQLLGDEVDDVDVEAHDLAAVVVELERLVGDVGAGRQLARLHQLRAAVVSGRGGGGGRAGTSRVAAARGQGQSGGQRERTGGH